MKTPIDLCPNEATDFLIGGKTYTVRAQPLRTVRKVLEHVYRDTLPEEGLKDNVKGIQHACQNWEESLPILAIVLGCADVDQAATVEHLAEHLNVKGGLRIVEEWWRINGVEDFLYVAGQPLINPELLRITREMREAREELTGSAPAPSES